LHPGTNNKASPEEIETALLADQQKEFDENWAYHIRVWSGMSFEKWKRENIKKRMEDMAAASWSDEARKKRKKNKESS
jgi:hypothetical protein